MAKMTFGVFSQRTQAEAAIADLENLGYAPKDISIIMQDAGGAKIVAHSTGANVADGAVSGATTGGVLGGIAGLLVGIGAITFPGVGALFIGGPIAVALGLSGAAATTVSGAVTGGVTGGLIGALIGLGLPQDQAEVYEREIKRGAILLAVPGEQGDPARARQTMRDDGAVQVNTI